MRVGVILAARAPAPYLAEALDSVLSQDPAPDEVVLVDHASAPALTAPDGVRMVRLDDASGGPAAARAAGLRQLDTELVAMCDSDDTWERGKLAAQLAALDRHPDAAVCFGPAEVVDADGRPTGERWPELAPGMHSAESLRTTLFESNPIPFASAVIRRSSLDAVGGFDGGLALPAASDWDLWLRLLAAGHAFVCEPVARIRYRRHAGGVTHDVSALGRAGLALHEAYADGLPPDVVRRARARDLTTLARGRIRQRRWRDAGEALRAAADLEPPGARERMLRLLVAVPGARGLLGRRDPYERSAR